MTTLQNSTSSLRMLPALMSEQDKQRAAKTGSAANASAGKTSSTAAEPSGDFYKQLLTILALSMAMPSSSGSSGLSSMSGMSGMSGMSESSGMGNFMAPVLLTLIEKLLSNQVEQAEPEAATIQKGPAEGIGSAADMESFGDAVPGGYPARGPMTQGSHPGHVAVDIGVSVGTDIKTTMDGKVVYAGWNNEGYGNLVIVENGPYRTYYGHFSKVGVNVGDTVKAGDVVGKSGNTGNSTGPHLHYEVRVNNQQVNPTQYLNSHKAA